MKFKYKVESYTKNASGLNELNADGGIGWEIVFVLSESDKEYTLLLKKTI